MSVNETIIALLRPKPDMDKLTAGPPEVRAAAQAVVDAPGGVGRIGSSWTEVPLPPAGSWSTPGRGSAQADIVLTAPHDGVPLLFVELPRDSGGARGHAGEVRPLLPPQGEGHRGQGAADVAHPLDHPTRVGVR
ncbi:hypothetical protein [Streptomyces sp. NPDC086838]|uniref:hypothetical protein n=1 Tax=Streptomyces sp. NPDC086838 TaxID=3365762 RepID=UPI0038003BAB